MIKKIICLLVNTPLFKKLKEKGFMAYVEEDDPNHVTEEPSLFTPENIPPLLKQANVISLAQLQGLKDKRLQALVWTFDESMRDFIPPLTLNNTYTHSFSWLKRASWLRRTYIKNGKWFMDQNKKESKPFACQNKDNPYEWKITPHKTVYSSRLYLEGEKACFDLGESWHFSVPKTFLENEALLNLSSSYPQGVWISLSHIFHF
jgi:hypothetical protein